MHYYPHHIGDYRRKTATLSLTEHGAYRTLMDEYYVSEGVLPDDHAALCRVCRAMSKVERDAVKMVMTTFFVSADNKLTHKRIEEELEAYRANSEKNRANGLKGGRPPKAKPNGNPVGSVSLTQLETQNLTQTKGNQEPVPINQIVPPYPPTPSASPSSGDGDESKAKRGITEGTQSKRIPTTPQSKRIAAILHRREATPWTDKEVRAYKKLGIIPEEDLKTLETYYAENWPPTMGVNQLRHDLLTLLNNFPGEVGRAQIYAKHGKQAVQGAHTNTSRPAPPKGAFL